MTLAVEGISFFYTGLSGAMLWSCLLDSGVDFTYRPFTSDYTEKRPSLHTGACHCQGFKEPLRSHPRRSREKASVPQNWVCSKCWNTNVPFRDYITFNKILTLKLCKLLWNCLQRHPLCMAVLKWSVCLIYRDRRTCGQFSLWLLFFSTMTHVRGINFDTCILCYGLWYMGWGTELSPATQHGQMKFLQLSPLHKTNLKMLCSLLCCKCVS